MFFIDFDDSYFALDAAACDVLVESPITVVVRVFHNPPLEPSPVIVVDLLPAAVIVVDLVRLFDVDFALLSAGVGELLTEGIDPPDPTLHCLEP